MIATRYTALLCAVLSVAVVPTVIHSYRGLTVDDGRTTAAIPETLAGMRGQPTGRKASWATETLRSHDFIERRYQAGAGEVQLLVARSFDAKRLYHHPELAVLRGTTTTPVGTATLPGRPDAPVHVLTTSRSGRTGVAVYALLYEGTFVERPVLFQLRMSAALLASGRRPMTLFMASDLSGSKDRLADAPSVKVLEAAIAAFETQNAARED